MPHFSAASVAQLSTCDERLQALLREAITLFDFTVVEGHRGELAQNAAYAKGLSHLRYPHGKHNSTPSRAVDIAPYPIDWSNKDAARQRFVLLAGYVLCLAAMRGLKLRWGGDWDGDHDTRDESFRDLPHFELVDP